MFSSSTGHVVPRERQGSGPWIWTHTCPVTMDLEPRLPTLGCSSENCFCSSREARTPRVWVGLGHAAPGEQQTAPEADQNPPP